MQVCDESRQRMSLCKDRLRTCLLHPPLYSVIAVSSRVRRFCTDAGRRNPENGKQLPISGAAGFLVQDFAEGREISSGRPVFFCLLKGFLYGIPAFCRGALRFGSSYIYV